MPARFVRLGDNALTAKAIADEAGEDNVSAEAAPENGVTYIHHVVRCPTGREVRSRHRRRGPRPAALANVDVGVAMNSGTWAAKEAGNIVNRDFGRSGRATSSTSATVLSRSEIARSCGQPDRRAKDQTNATHRIADSPAARPPDAPTTRRILDG